MFVKKVDWVYNQQKCNYEYRDEWGDNFVLLDWKVLPREPDIKVYVDMTPFKIWKYGNKKM
jgi:hypothetical protein